MQMQWFCRAFCALFGGRVGQRVLYIVQKFPAHPGQGTVLAPHQSVRGGHGGLHQPLDADGGPGGKFGGRGRIDGNAYVLLRQLVCRR